MSTASTSDSAHEHSSRDAATARDACSLQARKDLLEDCQGELWSPLSCAICHSILAVPQVLDCCHSFCGPCIHAWIGQPRAQGDYPQCPQCRHEIIDFYPLKPAHHLDSIIESQLKGLDPVIRREYEESRAVAVAEWKAIRNPKVPTDAITPPDSPPSTTSAPVAGSPAPFTFVPGSPPPFRFAPATAPFTFGPGPTFAPGPPVSRTPGNRRLEAAPANAADSPGSSTGSPSSDSSSGRSPRTWMTAEMAELERNVQANRLAYEAMDIPDDLADQVARRMASYRDFLRLYDERPLAR